MAKASGDEVDGVDVVLFLGVVEVSVRPAATSRKSTLTTSRKTEKGHQT